MITCLMCKKTFRTDKEADVHWKMLEHNQFSGSEEE